MLVPVTTYETENSFQDEDRSCTLYKGRGNVVTKEKVDQYMETYMSRAYHQIRVQMEPRQYSSAGIGTGPGEEVFI